MKEYKPQPLNTTSTTCLHMGTQITVRDVDPDVFRKFKAYAILNGMNVGQAINLAMKQFLSKGRSKKRLSDLKPIDWGPGTEHASEQIDETLYEGH